MTDLVDDDVVEHVVRREDEAPVEAERAGRRAGSPAAALVAQRDARVGDAERGRLRLREERDARERLAPALLGGQREPVEPELGTGGLRQLALEPAEGGGDRGVDLRLCRARADDELRREAVADDDPVAADARRPPYVQLDQTVADLHEAHGWMVRVAPDGNACDTTCHQEVSFALCYRPSFSCSARLCTTTHAPRAVRGTVREAAGSHRGTRESAPRPHRAQGLWTNRRTLVTVPGT